jgi:hypothetical protein
MVGQKRVGNTSAEKPTKKTRSNIKVNPKTKILNTIAKLRNEKAPNNGLNRTGYTFLSSLYRDHPLTQLEKYAFGMSNNEQREFIYKQHQTLTKQSSLLHTKSDNVTINMNPTKMHDLLIMLWMDMSHDKMFENKKESFNKFLTGSIKNEITTINIQPTLTDLVKDLIKYNILKLSNGTITLEEKIESKQKDHMHDIWGDPSHPPKIIRKSASVLSIIQNKSKPIYVSYDSEKSSYISELLSKSKMNNGTYYLKRIFTVANLMDPGRGSSRNTGGTGYSGTSFNKLINRLFDQTNTSTPFKFNYQMFTFTFGEYFKVEIVRDGYKFNAKLNGKMMNMQIKAAVARSGSDIDKISKTFGDFIQILTVGHLRKSGINVVSSTFDGGFIGMTGFVQGTLFEIEPAIIFDASTMVGPGGSNGQTGIKFHGLHKYLKYNANPERSRVTSLQKRPNRVVTPKSINNNVTQIINAKTNAAKANAAKANAAKANAAKANAAKANAAKANAAKANAAKANAIQKAKRNEFIKKIKKFTNLDNRTKRGFILGFNTGENANNLLRDAKRFNENAKSGLGARRRETLRSRKPAK